MTLLNQALAQTGWTGELLAEENWKDQVLKRIQSLNWAEVVDEVCPFVEPGFDLQFLTLDNLIRVLMN